MNEGGAAALRNNDVLSIGFTHFTIQQQLALELTDRMGRDPRVKPIPASSCSILPLELRPRPTLLLWQSGPKKSGCLTNITNSLLSSLAHWSSFEPIFELLAHLSGLDFCLCQRGGEREREREREREDSEEPLSDTPRCNAGAKTATISACRVDLENEFRRAHFWGVAQQLWADLLLVKRIFVLLTACVTKFGQSEAIDFCSQVGSPYNSCFSYTRLAMPAYSDLYDEIERNCPQLFRRWSSPRRRAKEGHLPSISYYHTIFGRGRRLSTSRVPPS